MSGSVVPVYRSASRIDVNRLVMGAGVVALAGLLGAVAVQPGVTWRLPALVLTGVAIGAVLLRTTFGFAGAFRGVVERRDASGFQGPGPDRYKLPPELFESHLAAIAAAG